MSWISVKEALPKHDGIYLTINTGFGNANYKGSFTIHEWRAGDIAYGFMLRKYYTKKKMFSNYEGNRYVTHWMSLPTPPFLLHEVYKVNNES